MRVLSVNVSLPKGVHFGGREIPTGIFKKPVSGPIRVKTLNLDGDGQGDLTVHGGRDKAVYAYSWKNIAYWREKLGRDDLRAGSFGENLTMDQLLDDVVSIGDELEIGTARFQVTQPRLPCFKLGIALGDPGFPKVFRSSGRNGFYLRVLEEGFVEAGDPVRRIPTSDEEKVTVAEFVRIVTSPRPKREDLRRLTKLKALSDSWKEHLAEKLDGREG